MNQSPNQPNVNSLSGHKCAQPKSWQVFGQNRALFVPVAHRAVQGYALNFFITNKWQRVAIWLAVRLGVGRKVLEGTGEDWVEITDTFALAESIFNGELAKNVNTEQMFFAMRQGSKGPYQKISLIAINQTGKPLFYAKVAVGAAADAMVDAESACLQRLSTINPLKGMVPHRLNFGKTASGRAFFTTNVASTLATKNQFLPQHEKFLSTLGHATVKWGQFANSAESQFAQPALERLRAVLGVTVHTELASAMHDILSGIGNLTLPTAMAHRDFAPWNIRWHQSDIFVFDWEYATDGANPLYDFFHFHLIQKALLTRSNTSISTYGLSLTSPALKYLQQYFPEINWSPQVVRYLLLAYMVDLLLFYVDSANIFDLKHPVIASYYQMICDRRTWL